MKFDTGFWTLLDFYAIGSYCKNFNIRFGFFLQNQFVCAVLGRRRVSKMHMRDLFVLLWKHWSTFDMFMHNSTPSFGPCCIFMQVGLVAKTLIYDFTKKNDNSFSLWSFGRHEGCWKGPWEIIRCALARAQNYTMFWALLNFYTVGLVTKTLCYDLTNKIIAKSFSLWCFGSHKGCWKGSWEIMMCVFENNMLKSSDFILAGTKSGEYFQVLGQKPWYRNHNTINTFTKWHIQILN